MPWLAIGCGALLLLGLGVLFRRRKTHNDAELLQELERVRVSPDAEVALVQAAGRLLVIGNHRKGVRLLCELKGAA